MLVRYVDRPAPFDVRPNWPFSNGELGAFFVCRPQVLKQQVLWQEHYGRTPVGAGDPAHLVLDVSRGLSRGADLFVGFSRVDDAWTDNGDGSWSADRQEGTSGNLRATGMGVALGKVYEIRFRVSQLAGQVIFYPFSPSPVTLAEGEYALRSYMTSANFIFRADPGSTATISNFSVREILGSHAVAPTSSARPTLEQAPGGRWYLSGDEVDDSLVATLPNLGTDATLFHATENGIAFLSGQAIGAGGFEVLRGAQTFASGVVNRALTIQEQALLQAYMEGLMP